MSGRAFVYGDDVDTDLLAPGWAMKLPPEELARKTLIAIDPAFAQDVRPGDVLVAGRNFGLGSSREQAAVSLKLLGLKAVVAVSFARIFWRNAINLGLPAITLAQAGEIASGDRLEIDVEGGRVKNLTSGRAYAFPPFPQHLTAMMDDGGLIPHLKRRFAAERAA